MLSVLAICFSVLSPQYGVILEEIMLRKVFFVDVPSCNI